MIEMSKKAAKKKQKTGGSLRKFGGISDEATRKATGRSWGQWLKILDKAGARKMDHQSIAAHLEKHHPEVGDWWCQMVTVGYEQARGMRQKHEKPGGFEISGSKTIAAPVTAVFTAWQDAKTRRRWLAAEAITIRKATANKSMRITWTDGRTSVNVSFYAKGMGKSQVSVQHGKLPDAKAAARMKTYWAGKLDGLKALVEG